MSQRHAPVDARGRRLVAPIGLVLAVALIGATTWWLAGSLQVSSEAIPVARAEPTAGSIAHPGPQALAVLRTDTLSVDAIELVEALTNQSATLPGVLGVDSVTNVGVLTTLESGELVATPAFGSDSRLDPAIDLETRAQRAAAAQLGSAGLVSNDGRELLIAAELDPMASAPAQAATTRAFRDQATLAVSVSGLPVEVSFGGEAFTVAEATNAVRTDLALLVGLACVVPAAIALVALRRRVPAGALLAAGGSALLLAAILVNGEVAQGNAAPLDPDHPVAAANETVDARLRGTIPIVIDVTGAPDAFRRPDVLARLDALGTWLRDEYGVATVDLPTTLRAEAGAITGVDSLPSNPEDIASLLRLAETFGDGDHLAAIVNDDYSRTRLVAWLPSDGRSRIYQLADRLDRISAVVFDDLGISARFGADTISIAPTRQALAADLALLGGLAVALGGLVALATVWDRHRHEDRHRARHRRLFSHGGPNRSGAATTSGSPAMSDDDDGGRGWRTSLFARHGHDRRDRHRSAATEPPGRTEADPLERFEQNRESGVP